GGPQVEHTGAEPVFPGTPLREIVARCQRAEQRQEAALGRLELPAQVPQSEALGARRQELEDVDDAVGRPVPATRVRSDPGTPFRIRHAPSIADLEPRSRPFSSSSSPSFIDLCRRDANATTTDSWMVAPRRSPEVVDHAIDAPRDVPLEGYTPLEGDSIRPP